MANNIYTEQFYTKSETNSLIEQTASSIDLSVNQKLSNYSTTNEMTSAINLKATEITSTVSSNYVTKTAHGQDVSTLEASIQLKVDTDKLISSINASADVITLAGGSSINLSSAGKLIISAGNFKLNSAGNITCVGGTIGGFTISSSKLYNGKSTLTGSGSGVYIGTDGISLGTGSTFKVTNAGALTATNASISGSITATSGTFQNCTVTSSCTVPASTITGLLSANNIPNLNASKITTGTISASVLQGVNANFGNLVGTGVVRSGGYVQAGYGFTSYGLTGLGTASQPQYLIVQHEGQYWRRLKFVGGILVAFEDQWDSSSSGSGGGGR